MLRTIFSVFAEPVFHHSVKLPLRDNGPIYGPDVLISPCVLFRQIGGGYSPTVYFGKELMYRSGTDLTSRLI